VSAPLIPRVTARCWRVWQRDAVVWKKTLLIGFLPPLLEPLLYVAAFGLGLGGLIGAIAWHGATLTYLEYLAPGIVGAGVMNAAFFETTFSSFVRMYYQKTFDGILATPLSIEEIVTGEVLWGATRAVITAAAMLAALAPFGLLRWPGSLLLLPVAALGGLAFAAFGMVFTGVLPTIEGFNLPIFLVITPMFLFSGTFFPLEQLPLWAQRFAWALPLTHLVHLARSVALGVFPAQLLADAAYLALFAALAYVAGVRAMVKRLIT
jgi:lipooligosaccharide transport system permease protein